MGLAPRCRSAGYAGAITLAGLLARCSPDAGAEGSTILVPYAELAGGMLFASAAIPGSDGYDLWWVSAPQAATVESFAPRQLTDAAGNEWQPSVSRGGKGVVFAREGDGIFRIDTDGRVHRVSDTSGTPFLDSLPAISMDGDRVAWVRQDSSRAIGTSGFIESYIMLSDADGSNARALRPIPGVVQDAPVFEPASTSTRIAWSEFAAETVGSLGPTDYGLWIFDFDDRTGRYLCEGEFPRSGATDTTRVRPYRCFGQHLAWPLREAVVLAQDFVEVGVDDDTVGTIHPKILTQANASLETPDIREPGNGFFPAFPISASYSVDAKRLVFDGIVTTTTGDRPTLGFFLVESDGGGLFRLHIQEHDSDLDANNTAGFLFSVATPQLVP